MSIVTLVAYADRSATCSGAGDNDYVVATIERDRGDKFITLKSYGNLRESTVYVTVEIKRNNGTTVTRSEWINISYGSTFKRPEDFGEDNNSSKFTSVKVSNPKCQ